MKKLHARHALQTLGKRVTALRLVKGWNRTTLAAKADVTVATIRGLEQGTKVTQHQSLRRVATALRVSVERLETDEAKNDPRVQNWTDEDYEIGRWYHHAPRPLKNQIWALQEMAALGSALLDPQFAVLLDGWTRLDQDQKKFVLNSFQYISKKTAD